jgi:hypothetical protein
MEGVVDDSGGDAVDDDTVDCKDGFCTVAVLVLSPLTLSLEDTVPFLVVTNGAAAAADARGTGVILEMADVDFVLGFFSPILRLVSSFRSAEATRRTVCVIFSRDD